MFLDNKYTRWYYSIINKALSENRVKGLDQYYENHHIIPKCMEGKNTKDNLVLLTAREHFVSHLLLCRMVSTKTKIYHSLICAVLYFKGQNNKKQQNRNITCSYLYEKYRQKHIVIMKSSYAPLSEKEITRRIKISNAMKAQKLTRDYSHCRTDEYRKQCSINGKKAHPTDRIYKRKNNPNPKPKAKKTAESYKMKQIQKNDTIKNVRANQIPQYMKYGWKVVVPTGFEPVLLGNLPTCCPL